MQETMLKIEHVSKRYRLGMIGGTTLREELQRLHAKMQNKEDPTRKIGAADYVAGETFMALNDVSFSVKKGERVGIIGHNGAGKSTLLKLISRITAPTDGDIWMNGRVASMLEVGTGFHGELTGRENIYMNGAILGMNKKEIDAKMEDIIEFSECRQFIDTPVKRYSSGMYVKLAFSVAAHLDSEIMIMDEVLAVGDMAFQKKCLEKMSNVSKTEGRTILYVSHNMSTIRQLCDRCIVMDHGHIIFDGNVEEAIALYLGHNSLEYSNHIIINSNMRDVYYDNPSVSIEEITVDSTDGILNYRDQLRLRLILKNHVKEKQSVLVRIIINSSGVPVTMAATAETIEIQSNNDIKRALLLDTSHLTPGLYSMSFVIYKVGDLGADINIDVVRDVYTFSILGNSEFNHGMAWNPQWWGHFSIGDLILLPDD